MRRATGSSARRRRPGASRSGRPKRPPGPLTRAARDEAEKQGVTPEQIKRAGEEAAPAARQKVERVGEAAVSAARSEVEGGASEQKHETA